MKKIHPITSKTRKNLHKGFFVLDCENWGGLSPKPENLALCVIYGHNFHKILYTPEQVKNELKKERYKNKKIFAHNGEYDFSLIFGNIILDLDNSAIYNGKFIMAKYGKCILCDSTNIYPASVSKIGDMEGYKKGETPKKFIEKNIPSEQKVIDQNDIDYCIRDCKIMFDALLKMFYRIGGISITIASCAMYNFKKNYLKKPLVYNDFNDYFFKSYYGGRTEAFKIGKTYSKVIDINSLYPYIMINIKFPDIKNLKKYENPTIKYFNHILTRNEGMAKVTIKHKESSVFGFIPKRHKIGNSEKLLFPAGTFTTYANFPELRFAIERGIIEIINVEYCVYAPPMESPFIEYVNEHYDERKECDNDLMKFIIKLLLNSLYGKFGMKQKYQSTYYDEIPFEEIKILKAKNKFYELKLFSKDRNDCYLVTENEKHKKAFHSIASIASYITSEARLMLLKAALKNEKSGIVYMDTDSLFIEKDPVDIIIGNELGQWKVEENNDGSPKIATVINGLKNYNYIGNYDGDIFEAIKGISKSAKKIGKNKYKIEKYYKTKEAIRRGKVTGDIFTKTKELTHKYDKRILNKDGSTKIIILKEI